MPTLRRVLTVSKPVLFTPKERAELRFARFTEELEAICASVHNEIDRQAMRERDCRSVQWLAGGAAGVILLAFLCFPSVWLGFFATATLLGIAGVVWGCTQYYCAETDAHRVRMAELAKRRDNLLSQP